MTTLGIQMLFKRTCAKAGLVSHSVHDLRHTKGRELAMLNLGAYRIARYLRQRSPASADRYVDLKDDREADVEVFNKAKVY